jgi:hypothetical protein
MQESSTLIIFYLHIAICSGCPSTIDTMPIPSFLTGDVTKYKNILFCPSSLGKEFLNKRITKG